MKIRLIVSALIASFAFNISYADGFAPEDTKYDQPSRAPIKKKTQKPLVRPFNSTAINSPVAVKDTPAPEIILPGVMRIEGESLQAVDPTRGRTMPIKNGQSQTVWMSARAPNRIQLPFNNPYIIRDNSTNIKKRAVSNNIYIQFTDAEPKESTQIFIESEDGSVTIGLELIPKDIPSQTLVITDDRQFAKNAGLDIDSDNFISLSQSLLGQVQVGATPVGYTISDLDIPPISFHGLVVSAKKRFSGQSGDIYLYQVFNPGRAEAMIDESEFDAPEVSAVSCFPNLAIKPSQSTNCAVLTTPRVNGSAK